MRPTSRLDEQIIIKCRGARLLRSNAKTEADRSQRVGADSIVEMKMKDKVDRNTSRLLIAITLLGPTPRGRIWNGLPSTKRGSYYLIAG